MSEQIARQFHDTYERLAPQFSYETREDTKVFDPQSHNGRLMIAVCAEIIGEIERERDEAKRKVAELQAGLDDIEEYGTEEINTAVDLRHQLAAALVALDEARAEVELLADDDALLEEFRAIKIKAEEWQNQATISAKLVSKLISEKESNHQCLLILERDLYKAREERDKAISVAERLVEYAHECLVKLQSWGQGYRRYEEEMDSIREDIAAYNMMKDSAK